MPRTHQLDADLLTVFGSHGRCTFLLGAMTAMIVLAPFGTESFYGALLANFLRALVLVFAIYTMSLSRVTAIVLWAIAGLAVLLDMGSIFGKVELLFDSSAEASFFLSLASAFARAESLFDLSPEVMSNLSLLFSTLVYLSLIRYLLGYILSRGPVTADKLHGALAAYIALAFLWAGIYVICQNVNSESFLHMAPQSPGDPFRYNEALFLSFSSLTQLGFGPVTPLTDLVRMLNILQQLVGVFFVAVLIARLAGVYPPQIEEEEDEPAAEMGQNEETASG